MLPCTIAFLWAFAGRTLASSMDTAQCPSTVAYPGTLTSSACPLASTLAWSQSQIIDIVIQDAGRGAEPQASEGAGIKTSLLETIQHGREFPKELYYYSGAGWGLISKESYQTFDELELIEENLDKIVTYLGDSLPLELGPGTFEKTECIVRRLNAKGIHRYFIVVDICRPSLLRIRELNAKYPFITLIGLHATFDDAFYFMRELLGIPKTPLSILSFGSTLTNAPVKTLDIRLRSWGQIATLGVLGQDTYRVEHKDVMHSAYHSRSYEDFIQQGFERADEIINRDTFKNSRELPCLIEDHPYGHARQSKLENGQIFRVFTSVKYTRLEPHEAFRRAPSKVVDTFTDETTTMSIFVLLFSAETNQNKR